MLSGVSGELVGSGKPPAASFVPAKVGLLSSVCPLVGFQVAGFCVSFCTTFLRASVDHLLPLRPHPLLPGLENFAAVGACLGRLQTLWKGRRPWQN